MTDGLFFPSTTAIISVIFPRRERLNTVREVFFPLPLLKKQEGERKQGKFGSGSSDIC